MTTVAFGGQTPEYHMSRHVHLYTIQLITTGTSPQPSFQLVTSKNSWSPAHTFHEGGSYIGLDKIKYAPIFTKNSILGFLYWFTYYLSELPGFL